MSNWLTPIGKALFPHLNEPDTKFEEDGVYTVNLILTEEESLPLIENLDKKYADDYAGFCREKKKQSLREADRPWSKELDQEGNLTGNYLFKFKMRAKTKKGIEQRPALFDAKRHPMTEPVGTGSLIKVSFDPNTWHVPSLGVGMTLRLRGVQVLKLIEAGGGQSASALGFGDEDGFETAAADFANTDATDDTSDF